MQLTAKIILVALGVFLVMGLSAGESYAQGCCENQIPVNGRGAGDDGISGPLPTPGCTNEPSFSQCFRFDGLQFYHGPATFCIGPDPDGAGPATGTTCDPPDPIETEDVDVPALPGWGVILFLLLMTACILFYRSRGAGRA